MAWSSIQPKKQENRKNSSSGALEMMGRCVSGGRGGKGVGSGQNLKKMGGLHKIGGLASLCHLSKETLKIPHSPIIKSTLHSWLSPTICSRHFPSPSLRSFLKNLIPLLYEGEWRGGAGTMFLLFTYWNESLRFTAYTLCSQDYHREVYSWHFWCNIFKHKREILGSAKFVSHDILHGFNMLYI